MSEILYELMQITSHVNMDKRGCCNRELLLRARVDIFIHYIIQIHSAKEQPVKYLWTNYSV